MNDFAYCYWLMGFFELINPTTVSEEQVNSIKQHLQLVNKKEGIFCNWLQGFLDMNDSKEWDTQQVQKIKTKLSQEFLKIIDPSYPKNEQKELLEIHQTGQIKPKKESPYEVLC